MLDRFVLLNLPVGGMDLLLAVASLDNRDGKQLPLVAGENLVFPFPEILDEPRMLFARTKTRHPEPATKFAGVDRLESIPNRGMGEASQLIGDLLDRVVPGIELPHEVRQELSDRLAVELVFSQMSDDDRMFEERERASETDRQSP